MKKIAENSSSDVQLPAFDNSWHKLLTEVCDRSDWQIQLNAQFGFLAWLSACIWRSFMTEINNSIFTPEVIGVNNWRMMLWDYTTGEEWHDSIVITVCDMA